jgi:CoA-transferase family III
MTRPFEGIRIIDITHVLAGPFAAYQLAVLGADVIKVEHPDDPDQSRDGGTDRALNRQHMGTSFLTQGSNKRSMTLDLKTETGSRNPQTARRHRRCVGGEFPAGRVRGARARLFSDECDQPAADLLLDLCLWPGRSAPGADRL